MHRHHTLSNDLAALIRSAARPHPGTTDYAAGYTDAMQSITELLDNAPAVPAPTVPDAALIAIHGTAWFDGYRHCRDLLDRLPGPLVRRYAASLLAVEPDTADNPNRAAGVDAALRAAAARP